jgi:poly-D-alanine transfer protein DltD
MEKLDVFSRFISNSFQDVNLEEVRNRNQGIVWLFVYDKTEYIILTRTELRKVNKKVTKRLRNKIVKQITKNYDQFLSQDFVKKSFKNWLNSLDKQLLEYTLVPNNWVYTSFVEDHYVFKIITNT